MMSTWANWLAPVALCLYGAGLLVYANYLLGGDRSEALENRRRAVEQALMGLACLIIASGLVIIELTDCCDRVIGWSAATVLGLLTGLFSGPISRLLAPRLVYHSSETLDYQDNPSQGPPTVPMGPITHGPSVGRESDVPGGRLP